MPHGTPQEIAGGPLLRDYENPLVSLNKGPRLLGPAISWGGKRGLGGVPLDSHDGRIMEDGDCKRPQFNSAAHRQGYRGPPNHCPYERL